MSVAMVDSLALLNLDHKYPSTLTWIHRPSLKSLCINFGGELSTIAILMFAVLHVLLNSFALLNHVQSYHLHARQYIDMHPFAMHRFQGCRASLKSLWYIWHSLALSHQVMSDEAQECWIVFTWINTQPLLQYTSPTHYCSTSYIKQLPQRTTCINRRYCTAKSCS